MNKQEQRRHNRDVHHVKIALTIAAVNGIKQYLESIMAAEHGDEGALISDYSAHLCSDDFRVAQVHCRINGIPTSFEFQMRELYGSNK